jgi:hypothetical protein
MKVHGWLTVGKESGLVFEHQRIRQQDFAS